MKNIFDDIAAALTKGVQNARDMLQGNSNQNQGAEQAPSLLSAVTDAWTSFLNRAAESNQKNIQSGNYSVNPIPQALDMPFSNYDDLAQKATAQINQSMPKEPDPWESDTPFGDKQADDLFQQAVRELDAADPEMKSKNLFKDAYDITNGFVRDVYASDAVLPLSSKVNPFDVAESEWRKALDAKIGEYSAVGKGAEELRAMLEEGHFESERQHEENQRQGVINAAAAAQLKERIDSGDRQAQDMLRVMPEADAVRVLAQGMTYEQAENYLKENMPMYELAKHTNGVMEDYFTAYENLLDIGKKDAKGEELTEAEKWAWQDAVGEMDFLADWRIGLNEQGTSKSPKTMLTPEQQTLIENFGKDRNGQIADAYGLYSPYEISPKNQAIWNAYIQTPEGAEQYYQESRGTDHEQQAWDNKWFVDHRAEYEAIANRPDFQELVDAYQGSEVLSGEQIARGDKQAWSFGDNDKNVKPEEDDLFKAVAVLKGAKGAEEYMRYKQYELNSRMQEEMVSGRKQAIHDNGVLGQILGSVASVPENVIGGAAGAVDLLGQNIRNFLAGEFNIGDRRPVDTHTFFQLPSKMSQESRKQVMEDVNWDVNLPVLGQVDLFDVLYNPTMSGLDSMTSAFVGNLFGTSAKGAEKLTTLLMSSAAAQDYMQDVYEKGGSELQAVAGGVMAGFFEHFFEKYSVGAFFEDMSGVGYRNLKDQIKTVAKEMFVNAGEEGATEFADILMDYLLMKEKSDPGSRYTEYTRLGLKPDAAREKVFWDMAGRAAEAAGSGALMGGEMAMVANASANINTAAIDRATGKGFSPESIDTMYSLAEGEGASDKAKELARKFPKGKANTRQMGELFRELSNTMGAGIKEALHNMGVADIALRLGQETGALDRAAADAVTAMMQGENLSGEQVAALAANPAAMKIVNELFKPDTQAKGEAAGTGAAAGEGVSGAAERISREPVQFEPMPGMELPGKIDTSARGAAAGRAAAPKINVQTVIGQDKSAAAQRIESITEDEGGGVRVKLEDGQTVDLEDTGLSAPMQEAARAAAGMDRDKAAALMNAAQEALGKGNEGGDSSRSVPAQNDSEEGKDSGETDEETKRLAADVAAGRDFALGFSAVYDAAAKGQTREQVRTVYGEQLQEDVREKAYEAGRQAFERLEEQARQRNMEEAKAFGFRTVAEATSPAPGGATSPDRGGPAGVLFDRVGDSLRDKDGNVNNGKLLALKLIDRNFKQVGMQARVVDKLENDANGKYVHGTNIVYLSLDAEEGAITKAASHEGFHFISAFSPEMKKTITDFVLDKLGKVEGYDLERRIQEVRQQYRDGAGQELEQGEDRYHDGAVEEIVADSMLDVIGTRENMEQLMKQSKSTAEKIKEWITNTYQKFKDILNRLARNSPEVAALKDDVDYLGRISSMWQEGMRQAAEAYRQSQHGLYDSARVDADVQQYTGSMKTATSEEDMLKGLNKLVENLYVRGEMGWIRQNVTAMEEDKEKTAQNKKAWEDGLSRFKQALLDYKQQNIALSVALERNGLPATPTAMNAAISYAAQQYAEVTALLEDGQERANAQTDDGKYSLRTLPDGRKYVEVDTDQDIFDGIDEKDWPKVIKKYIKKQFKGTEYKKQETVKVTGKSAGEYAFPNNRSVLDTQIYNDKVKAGTELDHLIKASVYIGHSDDRGSHPEAVGGWQLYKTIFHINNRWYEGILNVMIQKDMNLAYDITQIRDVTSQPGFSAIAVHPEQNNVSNKSISNSGEKVNQKFSLPSQQSQQQDAAEWVRDDAELYAQLKQDPDARAALWMIERIYRNTTTGEGRTVLSEADLKKRLPEVVKRLKEQTGTTVSVKEMTKQIMTLWEALQKPGYQMGEMMQYARNMIERWIESAPGVMAEQDETTKKILQELKHPFSLTTDMKSEIKGTFGDARDFYRKNFGKLKIDNKALSTLADVWQETLTKLNPGVFAPDATEADMPIILDAWLETAGKREVSGEFGANIGAMSTDLAMNTILELFNTPDILQTRYEMNKARVDRTYQLYQAAERLIATVREGYQQKYNERINRYKDTEEKQKTRDRIARNLRAINSMTVKPTDRRHVPMELKEMAEQALDALLNGKSGFSKEKLTMLENEYRKLEGRKGELAGWEQETLERIEWLAENLDGKSLKQLSLEELEELGKLVGNLHHMMIDQNKAFIEGREVDIDQYNEQFDIDMQKKEEVNKGKAVSAARGFRMKNTTPVYFADQAGGVIKNLINNLFHGQRTAYRVAEKGHDLLGALVKNYHVNNWINDKTVKEITTEQGHKIKFDRRLALELAAMWNREIKSGDTKSHHLRIGGFTYKQSAADRLKMDTTTAHRLTAGDMAQITAWLGQEQMDFMNAVVSMLSNEIGAEGNKISLRLHGYEKFGEKNYYPYATDKRFTSTELTNTDERESQPKNKSFTKALTRYAMTPVAAGDFMDTVTGHINDMAIYCGFAETADVANRLMNRRVMGTDAETGEILDAESNWVKMEKAMGKEAVSYLRTLFKDVGGGIRADERGPWAKGLSQFKKASVAGNLSVWLQQPFAYLRAGAMVSPGYLTQALNPVKLSGYVERMYKHSEVAGIKRIGRFDTGTGKSMAQWIGESVKDPSKAKRVRDRLDEKVFGIGAEKADEWAWGFLWGAIEKEITHTTGLKYGSAEYWDAVKERFEDVANHTQVYDSVLTKSELMRSNNIGDKMATSFMAEPTLSANMLVDGVLRRKELGSKQIARRAGAFLAAALFTAIGKALPGAWRRKDDEGRTFGEKWLAEAVENFTYDISPAGLAGMIPWARDIISLFEGYDVNRSDMDAFEQINKAIKTLTNEKATVEDKIQSSVGAVANLFGVPVKNVWRDAEGIIRNLALGESASESRSSAAARYTILDSLNFEPFGLWDKEAAAYYDRMAQAMIKGDMNQYMELREYMEGTRQMNPKSIDKGLKERIYSAVDKDLLGEKKAIEMLGEFFDMKEDTAFYAIDKYREGQEHKDEEEWEYNKLGNVMEAVTAGKEIPKEEKQKLLDHGYTELELVQAIETEIGKLYKDGDVTKAEAEKMLRRYADMKDADEIYFDFDKWDYQKQQTKDDPNYSKYVDLDTAIKKGKSTDAAIQELTDHGFEMDDIRSHMKDTIGDMYKDGTLNKAQAKEKLKKVAGIEDTYTLYWAFDKWDYQLKYAADRNAPSWNMWRYLREAIDTGSPSKVQQVIKEIYIASDTFGSTISSAITSYGKGKYLELYNSGKRTEAADYQALLLTAYEAAGYSRKSRLSTIQGWVKNQNKEKQQHVKEK